MPVPISFLIPKWLIDLCEQCYHIGVIRLSCLIHDDKGVLRYFLYFVQQSLDNEVVV